MNYILVYSMVQRGLLRVFFLDLMYIDYYVENDIVMVFEV